MNLNDKVKFLLKVKSIFNDIFLSNLAILKQMTVTRHLVLLLSMDFEIVC
jgi:hypothetical protein